MYQQQSEVHLIKITLLLKRVNISVRFPCSISFALKNQNSIIEHKGIHELKKGQCIINQNIEIEVQVTSRRGIYDQKKVSLLIYMISANGKIPAGSVTIHSTEKNIADKRAPLQKCPDKNAQAIYSQNFEVIQVISKSEILPRFGFNQSPKGGIDLLASKIKYSASSKNILHAEQQDIGQNSVRSQIRDIEEGRMYSNKHQRSNKDLRLSQVGERQYERKGSRGRFKKFQELSKKSVATIQRESRDSCQLKGSRVSSQFLQGQEEQLYLQKSKIFRLQQDKASYIKKLAKIRDSLVRIDTDQRIQLQEEIEKTKYENDLLQDQMDSFKQITKSQQRKQRDASNAMKELKDELDKRKSRILQLDSSRVKIESQLGQKDKIIYQLQNQKKKFHEILQEEKSLVVSSQKRLELKQNSYKQQLKKMNEKYAQSESQRKKAVMDYNNILAEIQSNEKKNQLALREKQKNSIEQKSRLTKNIQQLNSQIVLSNEKILQLKITVEQYQQYKKKTYEINSQRQYKINRLNQENELLLSQIRSSEENLKKATQEKERLENLLNQDKVNYKKKYNETISELNILKDKLQKNLKLNANIESKLVELENQMQLQMKEKNNLMTKLQEYKRQVNKFLAEQENRQKMAQTLSIQNTSQNQKISQFKIKLDSQRRRYEQMENNYQEQVQYLVKSKEMLQNQMEETRWILEKEVQKFQAMSAKNKELSYQIIELSQKVIIFEEKQSSYIKYIQEFCQFKFQAQKQLQNLNQRVRTYAEKLKQRQQDQNNLQKKLENLKQQNYQLLQSLQKSNKNIQQKSQMLKILQQNAAKKQRENQNSINLLNMELQKYQQNINTLKQEIFMKNNQIQVVKENYKVINSDYSSLIAKSDNIRQEDRRKDSKIQQLQVLLHDQQTSKQAVNRQLERKKLELQSYRSQVTQSLQQFFNILHMQEGESKRDSMISITLPEQNLSMMLMQALKKRTALLSKHQQKLYQLSNKIKTLQNQRERQQKYIKDLEQHHESVLKKQQERYKHLSQQNVRQLNEFNQKMQHLTKNEDERSNQIQYYNNESKRYQALNEQLNQILTRLRDQNAQLKTEVIKLENQVFSYKQKEIKDKLLSNTEAQQLKHILNFEQERYRNAVQNHKEELKAKDKVISDRMEELKKWINKQQEWKMQIRKYTDKIKLLQSKFQAQNTMKENSDKTLRQRQYKMRALQQEILQLKSKIQQFKMRQLQYQEQSKKYKVEIETIEAKLRAKKEKLQSKEIQVAEDERKEKEKREKIQASKIKIELQNKQIRQKCVKLQSQIEFYKFYKIQSTRKIEQLQKLKDQNMADLIKYRQNSLKSQKEIGNFESKYYKLQVQMQSIIKQKSILTEENSRLKQKIKQNEEKMIDNQSRMNQLDSRDKEIARLNSIIRNNEEQYNKMVLDLKASLAKSKETVNEKANKIKELQKFIEEKYSDISEQRLKWQKQNQGQKNLLHGRIVQLEDKYQMIQQEFEFQKLQAIREIQSANGTIQELNEVIREKEEAIELKDEIINEQIVRLQELNIQLNECVDKWESEKGVYLPTETKMAQINEELTRMNKFISDLDGRNKQLLEINKRKMQQNIVSKPSITEQLKDVYVLLQKNKNRILNRCQTEKEKQMVISEFKAVQQKLDLTLKSTQIIVPKQ